MEGLLIIIGPFVLPLMIWIIFEIIIPSGEWCYKRIHKFFLRCPKWIQNIKNCIKKGIKIILAFVLGVVFVLGMCYMFYDSCTSSCSRHHYEGEEDDYEYFDDGHRPDRF